jgi:hypothetical protein
LDTGRAPLRKLDDVGGFGVDLGKGYWGVGLFIGDKGD